jgi:hypothetical protein
VVEFAKTTIRVFDGVVLEDQGTVDLVLSDTYGHLTHSIGLVDAGKVNFYDGPHGRAAEVREALRHRPQPAFREPVTMRGPLRPAVEKRGRRTARHRRGAVFIRTGGTLHAFGRPVAESAVP